jgi:catechol 2,3-dioxygenase
MDQQNYKIPDGARIGHIHLKVSNLQKSLDFYCGLLGFELITTYGSDAAFISAGGYHHHIGLNTWYSKNGQPPPRNTTGLFHAAILYPTRKDLATIVHRLMKERYPLGGTSDHGVSEAIYLEDPDKNGLELYWDKPESQWPRKSDGSIDMYTNALDMDDLIAEINR